MKLALKRCICAASSVLSLSVFAQTTPAAVPASDYPYRPVKIVIGFPAGGPTDIMARLFAHHLSESLKGNFVVDNRPGAGSTIGTDVVAKSAPDGYTLLLGTLAGQGIAPNLYKKLPYDSVKDLTPISMMASAPNMLVVSPELPITTVAELIDYAKKNPGKLNYASTGNGTSQHMAAELFKSIARIQLVGVNYRGSAPAITDLLAGQTNLMFDNVSTLQPYVKSGQLRALAVTSSTRLAAYPQLPTMQEAGVPGYEIVSWFGLLAPAGVPAPIVERLTAASNKLLRNPAVIRQLTELSAVPVGSTPEQFDTKIKSEIQKWGAVVKTAGIELN